MSGIRQMLFVGFFVILILSSVTICQTNTLPAERKIGEYQVKAVYLFNLLLFTEWPESESDASKDTIVIGIVGKDPFKDAFQQVEGKNVKLRKEKKLVIKRFGSFTDKTNLKECQLLFICFSEKKNLKKILARVKGYPVLTVADTSGFLEVGGMLNLLTVRNKIRWEINQTPVKQAKLRLSSQLLRSAVRIVQIPRLTAETNGKEAASKKSTNDTASDFNGGAAE